MADLAEFHSSHFIVSDLPFVIPAPGRHQVGGAPEAPTRCCSRAWRAIAPGGVLHVAQRRPAAWRALVEMLGFLAPELTVISFPAWDCLPYDRVSPHRDILARRIDALSRLSAMEEGARAAVVVTTVNAILQRVPRRAGFAGRRWS